MSLPDWWMPVPVLLRPSTFPEAVATTIIPHNTNLFVFKHAITYRSPSST